MDGRDFIHVADMLVACRSEGEWRSAVSRAYYAAFHVARRMLTSCGFAVPRGDRAHAYLWRRLANCGHLETESAGNLLNNLRGQRNYADYDVQRILSRADAGAQVQQAKEIIHTLDRVAIDPTRPQITNAMKDYERTVLKEMTWHS